MILYSMPDEGPMSKKHVVQLAKDFEFRGYIARAEHRGVTVSQLSRLCAYVEGHSRDWELQPAEINQYHVDTWLLQPATKAADSAFAEHLTSAKQPPAFFSSHFWGQPISRLLRSIQQHAATRGLSPKSAYWLSAY